MASKTATRFWRTLKAAGRPIPQFSDDDVTDFLVTEALTVRIMKEDEKARKDEERKAWKRDREALKHKAN